MKCLKFQNKRKRKQNKATGTEVSILVILVKAMSTSNNEINSRENFYVLFRV
jgi:hypothetical protein